MLGIPGRIRSEYAIGAISDEINLTFQSVTCKHLYSKKMMKGRHYHAVANHTRLGVAFTQASRKNTLERSYEAVVREIIWKKAPGHRQGCELCGKSRMEFLRRFLKEEGVFLNYDDVELERDLSNMESSSE